VWADEKTDFEDIAEHEAHKSKRYLTVNALINFWPRLTATSLSWIANGMAALAHHTLWDRPTGTVWHAGCQ